MFKDKKDKTESMNFNEYMDSLGLLSAAEKQKIQQIRILQQQAAKAENARLEKEALAKADNILQLRKSTRKGG